MAKIGEQFVDEMIDRGRRELASVMFTDSNAQPLYPLRGYTVGKEVDTPAADEHEKSILDEHLERVSQSRDDPGRDGPDIGRE